MDTSNAYRITPPDLLNLYRVMTLIRVLDERMTIMHRQGRVSFYASSYGQEAACLGSAWALRPTDWIFPALREGGAMLLRGFPLFTYISQMLGNAEDIALGRQMPCHPFARSVNQVSWSSCIGTQLPQAVGAALAAQLKGDDTVIMAYLGDGATSTGDFHAAMNFAGIYKVPVVFVCQNNRWALSIPVERQSANSAIAEKAQAYGFSGVHVDGTNIEKVYAATAAAVDRARRGEGPTLIEAETYRLDGHSTSDDPDKYRDRREVEEWKQRDPLGQLRNRLFEENVWTPKQDANLREELTVELKQIIHEAEQVLPPPFDSLFEDVYAEIPWHLRDQRMELFSYSFDLTQQYYRRPPRRHDV